MWMLLALVGCVDSDLGKTLVYALDAPPEPVLDRQTCGTGVGLAIPMGIEQSLALDIASSGQNALLATCVLDDGDGVISCASLLPDVILELSDDGSIVGLADVRVSIQDTLCSGATLENTWSMAVEDDRLTGSLQAVWQLDDTNACEDFEGDVIASSGNGRGVSGCTLDYPFAGSLVAKCRDTVNGFRCDPP